MYNKTFICTQHLLHTHYRLDNQKIKKACWLDKTTVLYGVTIKEHPCIYDKNNFGCVIVKLPMTLTFSSVYFQVFVYLRSDVTGGPGVLIYIGVHWFNTLTVALTVFVHIPRLMLMRAH